MEILFDQLVKLVPLNTLTFLVEVAILAYLVWGIRPQLGDLTKQVKYTNGSVTEIKAWREGHDKQDDERHDENVQNLKEMNQAIRDLVINQRRA